MDADSAESSSRVVGLVTLATGAALALAPDRAGRPLGIDDRRTARPVGVGDLVLAPGIVMLALTVSDTRTALGLYRAGR